MKSKQIWSLGEGATGGPPPPIRQCTEWQCKPTYGHVVSGLHRLDIMLHDEISKVARLGVRQGEGILLQVGISCATLTAEVRLQSVDQRTTHPDTAEEWPWLWPKVNTSAYCHSTTKETIC